MLYSRKRRKDEDGKQSDNAAHFLSHNAQRPTKETEHLHAVDVQALRASNLSLLC